MLGGLVGQVKDAAADVDTGTHTADGAIRSADELAPEEAIRHQAQLADTAHAVARGNPSARGSAASGVPLPVKPPGPLFLLRARPAVAQSGPSTGRVAASAGCCRRACAAVCLARPQQQFDLALPWRSEVRVIEANRQECFRLLQSDHFVRLGAQSGAC